MSGRPAGSPQLGPGMRQTRQRRLIYQAILDLGHHCTAEEIAAQLEERQLRMPRSTVYRGLEALSSAGIVRPVNLGDGAMHYEAAGEDHQHAICRHCQGVMHLEDDLLTELEEHLASRHRFIPERTEVLVVGLCAGCAGAEEPPARPGRTLEHVHY
jgi:Fur family transcriptional regulator, ferric uptake regulator